MALSEKLLRDESHEALVKVQIKVREIAHSSPSRRRLFGCAASSSERGKRRRRTSSASWSSDAAYLPLMPRRPGRGAVSTPGTPWLCVQSLVIGAFIALCFFLPFFLPHFVAHIAYDERPSVIRDTKNLNITRDKVLLWHATDLLLECAVLRLRLNEAELRTLFSSLISCFSLTLSSFSADHTKGRAKAKATACHATAPGPRPSILLTDADVAFQACDGPIREQ